MSGQRSARSPSLSAGIGMVGTAYGMARYGYGLLLPDIRRDLRPLDRRARRDRGGLLRRLS